MFNEAVGNGKIAKERSLKSKGERYNHFYKAIQCLENADDCKRFLADILSPLELAECTNRWAIASLLLDGVTQNKIVKLLGVSSATVTRVNACLQRGEGGYKKIWKKLKKK